MADEPNNGGENGGGKPAPELARRRCSLADLWDDLSDPHRSRGNASILASAIRNGYIDAFCVDYDSLRVYAAKLQKDPNPRLKAAGAKLMLAMALHDLELMKILDKSKRLDTGGPTELVKVIQGIGD